MNERRIPRVALILGLAGLIPFVASALAGFSADSATSALGLHSLAVYAAVILSFLGGVRWGTLLTAPAGFDSFTPAVITVLPSILAWLALLLPAPLMMVLLLAGLALQYLVDSPFSPFKDTVVLPPWYPSLRLILSAGAIVCVACGLFVSVSG